MQNTTRRTATTTMLLAATAGAITAIAPGVASAQEENPEETTTTVEETTTTTEAPTTTVVEVADPAAPAISEVEARFEALSVTWEAPEDQSDGDVLLYHVMAMAEDQLASQLVVPADVHQASLVGLENGTTYDVVVLPYTAHGAGIASEAVSGTPHAEADEAGPAAAVEGIEVAKGRSFATVSWAPTADDGGSPVVAYSVVALNESDQSLAAWRNVAADRRNASISGLPTGTYELYVIPVTAVGFGAVSEAVTVDVSATSLTLPAAPVMPWASVVPVADYAVVSIAPAMERGEAVTRYHVVVIQGDEMTAWKVIDGGARQTTVPVGEEGEAQVYVFAESASGFGPLLDPISVSRPAAD